MSQSWITHLLLHVLVIVTVWGQHCISWKPTFPISCSTYVHVVQKGLTHFERKLSQLVLISLPVHKTNVQTLVESNEIFKQIIELELNCSKVVRVDKVDIHVFRKLLCWRCSAWESYVCLYESWHFSVMYGVWLLTLLMSSDRPWRVNETNECTSVVEV